MLFIKKVYQYSKPLAIGMLFFVVVQLFCFYKGGMVFSPWYNYGMYSERINVKLSYEAFKLEGVAGYDYSPQEWDKIHYMMQQYWKLNENDSLYEGEAKRIFQKIHLFNPTKSKFIFIEDSSIANNWFLSYLNPIDPKLTTAKNHFDSHYVFDGDSLIQNPGEFLSK